MSDLTVLTYELKVTILRGDGYKVKIVVEDALDDIDTVQDYSLTLKKESL